MFLLLNLVISTETEPHFCSHPASNWSGPRHSDNNNNRITTAAATAADDDDDDDDYCHQTIVEILS